MARTDRRALLQTSHALAGVHLDQADHTPDLDTGESGCGADFALLMEIVAAPRSAHRLPAAPEAVTHNIPGGSESEAAAG